MSQSSDSYAARCNSCDGFVAACADTPDRKTATAKFVGRLIKDGYTIARYPSETIRTSPWCSCKEAVPQQDLFAKPSPSSTVTA
jgi:hypothetical protein